MSAFSDAGDPTAEPDPALLWFDLIPAVHLGAFLVVALPAARRRAALRFPRFAGDLIIWIGPARGG